MWKVFVKCFIALLTRICVDFGMRALGFVRIYPEQIKKSRLSGIVALKNGTRLLNSPYKFK